LNIQFAEKLEPIFDPKRYKVIYGGRGGGRSWGVGRYCLIVGAKERRRFLCTREVQKSIKDSVHRLLSDQISGLGLDKFYEVLDTEIRGLNGSLFLFAGLSNQTADSIKSFEGIDTVWCEEAQSISKKSWDILIPTIRKERSEIIVTFNPELDTDETYNRFVVNTPPDTWLCELSYKDNPWFPEVLEQERLHCQLTDPESYPTIWEGKCRSAVIGAIYARELESAMRDNRVGLVPYDPRLKVHTVWDLGWNDSMTIGMVQKVRSEIRIIDYIEDSHKTLDWYTAELNSRRYNWGYDYLPHDGFSKEYRTGKSAEEILKSFGRKVKETPNIGVENGIKAAKMMFGQAVFDKAKCERLIECLKRYRRNENKRTEEFGSPLHDQYSHGADMFRYIAVNAESFTNENEDDFIPQSDRWRPSVSGMGY
jgi:phage terminase large subunit